MKIILQICMYNYLHVVTITILESFTVHTEDIINKVYKKEYFANCEFTKIIIAYPTLGS